MGSPVLLRPGWMLLHVLVWTFPLLSAERSGAVGFMLTGSGRHTGAVSAASVKARTQPSLHVRCGGTSPISALFAEGSQSQQPQQQPAARSTTRLSLLQQMCEDTTPQLQHEAWNPHTDPLLLVQDLKAVAAEDGTPILNGVTFQVGVGEVHAIMGRNGSG